MANAVVVGGGSAECVLAARLIEDAACQVVLLEAGQDLIQLAGVPPDVLDASRPGDAANDGSCTSIDRLQAAIPKATPSGSTELAIWSRTRPRTNRWRKTNIRRAHNLNYKTELAIAAIVSDMQSSA